MTCTKKNGQVIFYIIKNMPAKLDLTFANSITFYPVITYVPKNGNAFIK
jgi:hypothetical protein